MDRTATKQDTIPKEEADRLRDEVVRRMANTKPTKSAPQKPAVPRENYRREDGS